jgi:hypothetical protein
VDDRKIRAVGASTQFATHLEEGVCEEVQLAESDRLDAGHFLWCVQHARGPFQEA